MKKKIKIGIADDHLFVRQGLISLLKEFEEIVVLFDVGNGKEVLEKLKNHTPDIILLDIEMPVMDGVEVFDKIKIQYPTINVIIVSSHYQDSFIIEFVKKGVAGFLNKNSSIEKMVKVITAIFLEGYYYDGTISLIISKAISHSPEKNDIVHRPDLNLTDREIYIIRLICLNRTSLEISKELFISVRTVEGHRLHIRQKTNCKNAMDLIIFSIQNNLTRI